MIAILKLIWNTYGYKVAKKYVESTSNEYDNTALEYVDKFINSL